MSDLSKEAMESLNHAMAAMKGKTTAEKVEKIFMLLGIRIHPNEAVMSEKILKDIIEARLLRTCPKCKGEFTVGRVCDLCDDRGEVNGVVEENFFLNQLNQPKNF